MKLRNKKTGKIYNACNICFGESLDDLEKTRWKTLKEFCNDWEDCEPDEPLIKDEKIRKAVRAWAEVNELEPDFEVRYSEHCFGLISWQADINFNRQIDGLEHNKKYTITELCGEEE